MAEVTVKAQQSFGGIRAGEVVTVERTAYIDRRIESGRLVVVDETGEPAVPPRNGSRDEWAAYLTEHTDVEVGNDQGRDELIEAFDAHQLAADTDLDDDGAEDDSDDE